MKLGTALHLFTLTLGILLFPASTIFACTPATINWTGNVNNDWNNAANYSAAPQNNRRVVIDPANYTGAAASPVIAVNSNYNPNRVTVQNGANLTIQANLTLQNNLFAQPDFTVNNATSQVNMSAGIVDITFWGAKRDLNLQNAAGFTATGGTVNARDININATSQYDVTTATIDLTQDLNINGTLNFNSGNIFLERDFANNGTYSQSGGLVTFDGTGNQNIDGSSAFTDMTINNPGNNVTLNTGIHSIAGTLTLTNGTFVTNNTLTLLSTGSGTARIAAITGGAISGDITMQRYIGPAPSSWRFLSSAVSGRTLADWNDDIITSGFPGSDYPSFPFVSIYTYDESAPDTMNTPAAFVPASNITDPINTDEGYWVYVGPVPLTFDVTGPANTGTKNLKVSYNASGGPSEDGWCMVSNPYPSTIDWDGAGWTKTNIANAIYVWNPSNKQYAAYVFGIGINGGSRYIPSQQAFFVQAFAASPVLQVSESSKAATDQSYMKMMPNSLANSVNYLKLQLSGNGDTDESVILFSQGATTGIDPQYDALKLASLEPDAPYLASLTDTVDFGINGLEELTADVSIPVRVRVGVTGTYTISIDNLNDMPLSSCIVLEDLLTSNLTDLRTDSFYTFTIVDTTSAPRFLIHVGAPIGIQVTDVSCNGSGNGMAIAQGNGTPTWDYEWLDDQSNVLQSTTNSMGPDTLYNLVPGTYTVKVTGGGGFCGTVTDTFVITGPNLLTALMTATEAICNGEQNSIAIATPQGGTPGYSFLWTSGATEMTATGLGAGTHYVTITDANGCTVLDSVMITEPPALTSSITGVPENGGCDGSAAVIAGGGTPGYRYMWSNGATTATADSLCTGTYYLTVTDVNGCSLTDSILIMTTEIAQWASNGSLTIFPNPTLGQFSIEVEIDGNPDAEVRIINSLGQVVYIEQLDDFKGTYRKYFDLTGQAKGLYRFELITEKERFVQKIMLQ